MHQTRKPITDESRKLAALKWLSLARQATVDTDTFAAFVIGLQDLPADVVEQACKDIGYAARDREERETAWPELGSIRARCYAIMRHQREQAEDRRRQEVPKLPSGDKPIDPAKLANFKADVEREIARKRMR